MSLPAALVALGLGHPDATVVAQRLRHQGELGLVVAADTGMQVGMDLGEARVGEQCPSAVGAPDRGGVATLGVGRQEEDVRL